MQPDLLSERIEEFRAWLARYADTGVAIAPEAMIAYDALFADFVTDARNLEHRAERAASIGDRVARALGETASAIERADAALARLNGGQPLDRVIAEVDEESRATDAFARSMARTKDRLVAMRAQQDEPRRVERLVLRGIAEGKVAAFPVIPRPAFGARPGDLTVEQSLDLLTLFATEAPKSRFSDAPTFDTPEDCA